MGKVATITLTLLALAVQMFGQADFLLLAIEPRVAAGGGDPAFETFDVTGGLNNGFDKPFTTNGTGTINPDATPGITSGQSLRLLMAAEDGVAFNSFTAVPSNAVEIAFMRVTNNGTATVMAFRSTASSRCRIDVSGNDGSGTAQVTLLHGSASATITDRILTNTVVWIRLVYKSGTGANGFASCEWNTTRSFTGSGNKYAEVTVGTATSTVDRFYCGAGASETLDFWYDDLFYVAVP